MVQPHSNVLTEKQMHQIQLAIEKLYAQKYDIEERIYCALQETGTKIEDIFAYENKIRQMYYEISNLKKKINQGNQNAMISSIDKEFQNRLNHIRKSVEYNKVKSFYEYLLGVMPDLVMLKADMQVLTLCVDIKSLNAIYTKAIMVEENKAFKKIKLDASNDAAIHELADDFPKYTLSSFQDEILAYMSDGKFREMNKEVFFEIYKDRYVNFVKNQLKEYWTTIESSSKWSVNWENRRG
jgi:hypothetical protein